MLAATTPYYQLAVMCKHHTHFRHTHTGDDKNKCFALSLKVIERHFFFFYYYHYFALEVNGKLQGIGRALSSLLLQL